MFTYVYLFAFMGVSGEDPLYTLLATWLLNNDSVPTVSSG